ncbi:MAG: TMEM175 family protein [Mycobacteriales bacterium]
MTSNSGRFLSESNRVEAFSDGVLAIAITLLVLNLHTESRVGHVGHDLLVLWPSYLAYVASFLYIGVIWINHHALFNRIVNVDTRLLWCNLGLLLTAAVLPFPTAEVAMAMGRGTHGDQVSAIALYAVVAATMGVAWLLTFTYLTRHPELLRRDVPATFFAAERPRAAVGVVAPFVPVAVGLISPRAALGLIVLIPIFYAATVDGLRHREGQAKPSLKPWRHEG